MDDRPILIVGCGDVGQQAANLLADTGCEVFGLRRYVDGLTPPIKPIQADITNPASLTDLADMTFSQVLVTTAAGDYSEQRYRAVYVDGLANVLECLQPRPPRRVILTSSTSVYHQNDGGWVDEDSATAPTGFAGRLMLEAEALLLAAPIPATVVRFGGIYGPGRDRLLNRLRQGHIVPRGAGHYSNRIHSADCAAVLAHLVAAEQRGQALHRCYLAVDCAPTPLRQICEWLARAMDLDVAAMSEEPLPLRGGNKRCSNRRLLDSGYRFIYPDYRAGFGSLLQSEARQPDRTT
jgi:nucleoside-diphosphate-sugar epimerase